MSNTPGRFSIRSRVVLAIALLGALAAPGNGRAATTAATVCYESCRESYDACIASLSGFFTRLFGTKDYDDCQESGRLCNSICSNFVTADIDAPVVSTGGGRHLLVTGPLQCPEGATFAVRVTVTQRTVGAVAIGTTRQRCAGADQFAVRAQSQGRTDFQLGRVQVCALGVTESHGVVTDANQWCADAYVIPEGATLVP